VLGGHKALGLDKEVMMLECNKHFWGSLAAHYSRRDVLTRLDLGHVNIPTEIGDYISKCLQAALVHGLNSVRARNPVPPPPNKRKAGENSSVGRVSGRKVPKPDETNVVTVAPGGNTRLVVCLMAKEEKDTASAPTSGGKRKRHGAEDDVFFQRPSDNL